MTTPRNASTLHLSLQTKACKLTYTTFFSPVSRETYKSEPLFPLMVSNGSFRLTISSRDGQELSMEILWYAMCPYADIFEVLRGWTREGVDEGRHPCWRACDHPSRSNNPVLEDYPGRVSYKLKWEFVPFAEDDEMETKRRTMNEIRKKEGEAFIAEQFKIF
ncbi:hypothetical protein CEXT_310601 [Caerostris extrusa]|uniref:Uncharacterized protein n=1 Tax=Caerostris extrusa TaxID=172846 RepID=A0AAV4WVR9_CAEEX|nr:hypothetical protein CEXT_310601 [Caerostris extrusa]